MKNFNLDALLTYVSSICWEHVVCKTDNVNYSVYEWTNLFPLLIEKHVPLNRIRVSEKFPPWITEDLKTLMRTRDKLQKAAVKSNSSALMSSYRWVRNTTNSLKIQLTTQCFNVMGILKVLGEWSRELELKSQYLQTLIALRIMARKSLPTAKLQTLIHTVGSRI